MADLMRTRSVLDVIANGRHATSDSDDVTLDDLVWFEQRSDPGESLTRSRRVVVDRETFEDLGSPAQITMTIEPGDLLNG